MTLEEANTAAAIQTSEVTAFKDHITLLTEKVAVLSVKRNRHQGNVLLLVPPARSLAEILPTAR